MTFNIVSFFARGDDSMLEAALTRWPGTRGRVMTSPIEGIAVATEDLSDGSYEQIETQHALALAIADGLPEWSRHWPGTVFVYVEVDCFGGPCVYEGFVCRDGEVLHREPVHNHQNKEEVLGKLLRWLDVQPRDNFFEPFTRGYFHHPPARGPFDSRA